MNKTKHIIYVGLFCALTCVITILVTIPLGIFGYINLSDFMIMLLSPYFGYLDMVIIGGVGVMMADLFLGYSHYAIFTFMIKSLEAIFLIYIFKKSKHFYLHYLLASLIMLVGYGLVDIFLNQNLNYFILSIMANLPQAIVSYLLAVVCYYGFKRIIRKQVL